MHKECDHGHSLTSIMHLQDAGEGDRSTPLQYKASTAAPVLKIMVAHLLTHIRRGKGAALFSSILTLASQQVDELAGSTGIDRGDLL